MHRQSRRHDIVSCGVHVYIKKEMMEIAFQSLKLPFLKASTNKLLSEGYPGVLWCSVFVEIHGNSTRLKEYTDTGFNNFFHKWLLKGE